MVKWTSAARPALAGALGAGLPARLVVCAWNTGKDGTVTYAHGNRVLGWFLLVAAFVAAIGLDPWSLSERQASAWAGSARQFARHAQAVTIGLGFLQLIVDHLLTRYPFPRSIRAWVMRLSVAGTLLYTAGYLLFIFWPAGAWLSVAGALLNFLAFAPLVVVRPRMPVSVAVRPLLGLLCCGAALGALMALSVADPERFWPEYLGMLDGVRLRMLRLARAAIIALPLLTLLYVELVEVSRSKAPLWRWAEIAMLVGALGMPALLVAAALTSLYWKYLLGIPAQAMLLGTLAATWLAFRHARPLETWGWLLIAVSMSAGLLMGLYAFDGPLDTPAFLGTYNDYGRRLSRLVHSYAIVLGLLSICLARELDASPRVGVPLFVAGSGVLLAAPLLLAFAPVSSLILGAGPALVAAGLGLSLIQRQDAAKKISIPSL
jgi:hypothetical protein